MDTHKSNNATVFDKVEEIKLRMNQLYEQWLRK
jgi:hypothetical protein